MNFNNLRIFKYATLICIFFHAFTIQAHQNFGKIIGNVTTSDGDPAPFVNVVLKGTKLGTITNEDGVFEFHKVKPGNYNVLVSLTGYETTEQEISVNENTTTPISLQIKASNKELQEVIVTSDRKKMAAKESQYIARMPLKNLENPQVYSVINPKIIEQQVLTNFDDALKSAAGVVSAGSEPGVRSGSYLRGFDEQAFFRDGKMLGNWTENDMANIESIEIIKGPSGTLFGGHGRANYGGVINRITKKPYDTFGGNINYITGSYGYNRLTADVNTPLSADGAFLGRVNAAYRKEKSFQDYGWAESYFVAPSFTYNASEKLKFVVEADLYKIQGTQRPYLSASGITNVDELNPIHDLSFTTNEILYEKASSIFSVDAIYKLNDQWTSTTSFGHSYSLYNPNYVIASVTGQTVNRTLGTARYDIDFTTIQQYLNGDFKIGKMRNRLLVGIDYLRDDEIYVGSSAAYDTFQYTSIAPYLSKQAFDQAIGATTFWTGGNVNDRYSAYFSNVLDILPQLHLMTSLRYEYSKDVTPSATIPNSDNPDLSFNQGAWTPKFGLVYEILPEQLSVFGNYLGGNKNINSFLKDDGTGNGVMQKADPEKATQWELGIKSSLFQNRLTLMASYFDIKVDNKLRTDPVNQLFSLQDGTQKNKGFELELFATPITGLDIMLGYANLDATFLNGTDAGKHVAYTPKNTVNYWISYTAKQGKVRGLGIGFGGNYRDVSFLTSSNDIVIPGVHLLNASVFYEQARYRFA
ncbi:TonB-dependent receptor, partial [Flavobacterium sp.]|uniref:TonB-dependent receptor n=1 Tax=Flavobacterium sp. TaxID=239 RepID=UPI002EDB4B75